MALFRYSGNKTRYLQHYKTPPDGTKRIVEPYLGSGAYMRNYVSETISGLGFDLNPRIIDLWNELKNISPDRLREIQKIVDSVPDKTDLRKLTGITPGEMLYIKINICGVVVGQLSSWAMYNSKFKLPVEKTIEELPKLKNIEVHNLSADKYVEQPGDLVFMDPPYQGTAANYSTAATKDLTVIYDPKQTINLISKITSPIILTYGNGAPISFPDYKWDLVAKRKVPNLRRKGTVIREEWVAYVNW